MTAFGIPFLDGLAQRDLDRIAAGMTEDVVVQVAVHDVRMRGRDTARFLFTVLLDEFEQLEPVELIGGQARYAVRLDTRIAGQHAEAVILLSLDDRQNTSQMTVFFRPLAALQLIAERMGPHMEARFGPPPQT